VSTPLNPLPKPLRVLLVDDSVDDAELVIRELRRGGYDPAARRVVTPDDLTAALTSARWDVIVSGYSMSQLKAENALAIVRSLNLDIPFIISDRMASVGTLATGVAHQINDPLSIVAGNLKLVRQDAEAIAAGLDGLTPEARRALGEQLDPLTSALASLRAAANDAEQAAERLRRIVGALEPSIRPVRKKPARRAAVARPAGSTSAAVISAARSSAPKAERIGAVLVIEDEPALGRVLQRLLVPHRVTVMTRAAEALARLAAGEAFDLILCDLMMPEMTGMEFHVQLLRMSPQIAERVVFMSGGAFTPDAQEFLESTANRTIGKPIDTNQLRRLVEEALAREPVGR
jgi:CheY-like chemotaxis protein